MSGHEAATEDVSDDDFLDRSRPVRSTSVNSRYNVYEAVKPVTVQEGIAAPAFGYGGGGVQYEFGSSIQDLIDEGILKRVGP